MKNLVLRSLATAAIAALALTGCASDQTAETTETVQPAETSQTLRLAISAPPANFSIGNWAGGDATIFLSVYDTLVYMQPDGTLAPGLAESWEYSEDRMQLTFKLREGQSFSDGTPVDAAAVAASFEVARTGSSTTQNLASVTAVTAVDDYSVMFELAAPDAALLPTLAGTVGAIGATEFLTAESSQLNPIGSGPYVINVDETQDGTIYVLDKNENYWDANAFDYERVEVRVIADATATQNALLSGQLDFSLITPDVLPQFEGNPDFIIGDAPPAAFAALWLIDRGGTIVPALADVRVRKAINLALDRNLMVETLLQGKGYATNQIFSPVGKAFDAALLEKTAYDVAAAKALMAEAGYPNGFEVTMPSTVVSTMFESVLSQSLGEIGIEVTWEAVPFQDFYAKIFGGSYGMYFMYNGLSGSDVQDLNAGTSGIFNPFGQTTPEYLSLLAAVSSASDSDQVSALKALNAYLVEEAWYAPIAAPAGSWVTSASVSYTPPIAYGTGLRPYKVNG